MEKNIEKKARKEIKRFKKYSGGYDFWKSLIKGALQVIDAEEKKNTRLEELIRQYLINWKRMGFNYYCKNEKKTQETLVDLNELLKKYDKKQWENLGDWTFFFRKLNKIGVKDDHIKGKVEGEENLMILKID